MLGIGVFNTALGITLAVNGFTSHYTACFLIGFGFMFFGSFLIQVSFLKAINNLKNNDADQKVKE